MDYEKISQETMKYLNHAYFSLKKSPLSSEVRILLELLVSKINGCEYCIKLHTKEGIEIGIEMEKLENILSFSSNDLFSKEERVALDYAFHLTELDQEIRAENTTLHEYFSEREIVDITAVISIMNALNRMAISLKNH